MTRDLRPACSLFSALIFAFGFQSGQSPQPPTRIDIDVKPGDSPTVVERNRGGFLPVAVLSTPRFDARTLDRETVKVGPTGTEASPARSMESDVDADERPDLMLLVRVQDLRITCETKAILVKATTQSGEAVEGAEVVRVEGCGVAGGGKY